MRLALLNTIAVVVVVSAACPGAQKVKDEKPTAPAVPVVVGKYESACTASTGADGITSYEKTSLDVAAATWSADIVSYGDEACNAKQGTMHVDGGYMFKSPSVKVPGAFDVDLTLAHRTLTAHVEGYIALMQSYACGKAPYAMNEPQDLLVGGCKDLGLMPSCPVQFDVVKIDPKSLQFGKRPQNGDLCSADKRPTELGVVLNRRM